MVISAITFMHYLSHTLMNSVILAAAHTVTHSCIYRGDTLSASSKQPSGVRALPGYVSLAKICSAADYPKRIQVNQDPNPCPIPGFADPQIHFPGWTDPVSNSISWSRSDISVFCTSIVEIISLTNWQKNAQQLIDKQQNPQVVE